MKMVTRLQRDYLSQPTLSGDRGRRSGRSAGVRSRRLGETVGAELPAAAPGGSERLRPQAEELAAMAFQRRPRERRRQGPAERFAAIMARMADDLKAGRVRAARLGLERPGNSETPPARAAQPWRAPGTPAPAWASRRVSRGPPHPGALNRGPPHPGATGPPPAAVADRRLDLNQVSFEQLRSLDLSTTQCHRAARLPQAPGWLRVDRPARRGPRFPERDARTAQAPADRLAQPANCGQARRLLAWPP